MQERAKTKNEAIQQLLGALDERFGEDAFLVEGLDSCEDCVVLRSTRDRRVVFSVVTTACEPGEYSAQVEYQGREFWKPLGIRNEDGEELGTPFDIVVDRVVRLADLLAVFAEHQKVKSA